MTNDSGFDETMAGAGPPAAPATAQGADLPPGTAIGEYRIERVVGRGGMGTVYAAVHPVIGKRVAVKVIAAALTVDPGLVRRFVDEARAVVRIGHPNIVDVYSFGQLPDGRQYFIMELLEGETLADRMARGDLPPRELERLLLQTCDALAAAHAAKVIHRDLKPENLWIAHPKHGDAFIKVLDFGIAKLVEGNEREAGGAEPRNVTQTGVAMGTPHFMSPEQCIGEGVDHRTDVYAFGVILYRLYAGRLPFDGRSFAEVVAQQLTTSPPAPSSLRAVPPALDKLIVDCLAKDPAQRPQTIEELAARLRGTYATTAAAPAEVTPTRTGYAGEARPADGPALTRAIEAPTNSDQAERTEAPKSTSRRWLLVVALGLVAGAALAVFLRRPAHVPAEVEPPPAPAVTPTPAGTPPPAPTPPPVVPAPTVEQPPGELPAPTPRRRSTPAGRPGTKTRADETGLIKENPFQ